MQYNLTGKQTLWSCCKPFSVTSQETSTHVAFELNCPTLCVSSVFKALTLSIYCACVALEMNITKCKNASTCCADRVLISTQRRWLLPLVMPVGWGRGGWATSLLVLSPSCLLFRSGSCLNRCLCLWINTIPAALQSKPGLSKIPQQWSTSSDLKSQLIYIRWPKVWI